MHGLTLKFLSMIINILTDYIMVRLKKNRQQNKTSLISLTFGFDEINWDVPQCFGRSCCQYLETFSVSHPFAVVTLTCLGTSALTQVGREHKQSSLFFLSASQVG